MMLRSALKRTHPSADRNSRPISEALLAQVDTQTTNLMLLEIASGSGQHAGFLAPLLPNVTFQPTEYERKDFASISAYAADCSTGNICRPLFLDISQEMLQWEPKTLEKMKPTSFDYMLNCNMIHISPWLCSVGLFDAAGQLLKPGGKLFTYGPYAQDGHLSPQSNVNFDIELKRRNADWGIRDIRDLKQLAKTQDLRLEQIIDMPSNNKFLTWVKVQNKPTYMIK